MYTKVLVILEHQIPFRANQSIPASQSLSNHTVFEAPDSKGIATAPETFSTCTFTVCKLVTNDVVVVGISIGNTIRAAARPQSALICLCLVIVTIRHAGIALHEVFVFHSSRFHVPLVPYYHDLLCRGKKKKKKKK
jgi:hypothetical protein